MLPILCGDFSADPVENGLPTVASGVGYATPPVDNPAPRSPRPSPIKREFLHVSGVQVQLQYAVLPPFSMLVF